MMIEISAGPYYISVLILCGFFVYISPGLVDKVNGIPRYQIAALSCYLLVAIIVPILYFTVVFNHSTTKDIQSESKDTPSEKQFAKEGVYDYEKDAFVIFIAILVAIVFHLSLILPQTLCRCKRKCEFMVLSCLLTITILEIYKSDMRQKKSLYS